MASKFKPAEPVEVSMLQCSDGKVFHSEEHAASHQELVNLRAFLETMWYHGIEADQVAEELIENKAMLFKILGVDQ